MNSGIKEYPRINIIFEGEDIIPWYPPIIYFEEKQKPGELVGLRIRVKDQKGVLYWIARILYEEDADVRYVKILKSPGGEDSRIYIVWRSPERKLDSIISRLEKLSFVLDVEVREPVTPSLWINVDAGFPLLDPRSRRELMILRKTSYTDTIKTIFEQTGRITVVPYFHQMLNYGLKVAEWYNTTMQNRSIEEKLKAAMAIYRAFGLGFVRSIITRDKCYEIIIDEPFDPQGYCCPGTRGLVIGFLTGIIRRPLRAGGRCSEKNGRCVFEACPA